MITIKLQVIKYLFLGLCLGVRLVKVSFFFITIYETDILVWSSPDIIS